MDKKKQLISLWEKYRNKDVYTSDELHRYYEIEKGTYVIEEKQKHILLIQEAVQIGMLIGRYTDSEVYIPSCLSEVSDVIIKLLEDDE